MRHNKIKVSLLLAANNDLVSCIVCMELDNC